MKLVITFILTILSLVTIVNAQVILDTDWSNNYESINNLDPTNSAGQLFLKSNISNMIFIADITTEETALDMVEYNNDLYVATHTNPKNDGPGTIIRYNDSTGVYGTAYNIPVGEGLGDIRVLNGKIYVTSIDSGGSYGEIYIYNGSTWQGIITNPVESTGLFDIEFYNNQYYVAGYSRDGSAVLYSSLDGVSNWTQAYSQQYVGDPDITYINRFTQIAVFNGRMFFTPQISNDPTTFTMGGPTVSMYFDKEIFSFDGTTFTSIEFSTELVEVTDMEVFNNALYLSVWNRNTSVTGMWRTTDGVNFSPVTFFGSSPSKAPRLSELITYNNTLYVAEFNTSSVLLYESSDGTNWIQASSISATQSVYSSGSWFNHPALGIYHGRFYVTPPAQGRLYVAGAIPTGELSSTVKSLATQINNNPLYWNASIPLETTIKFQVRSATTSAGIVSKTFVGPDGTSNSYYTTSGTSLNSVHNGDTWLQYKVSMETTNSTKTLYLNDVSLGDASTSFGFSVSTTPTSGTVTQGNNITTTVTATLTSGTTQSVSFSASGLPTGASYSFSPTSCSPTCNSIINITTQPTTATETYPVIITATNGSLTRTTSYTLIIQSTGNVSLTNTVDQLNPVIANGTNVSIRIPLNYSGSGMFNAGIPRTWNNISNIRINESGTMVTPTVNTTGIYWQANLSKQAYLQFDVPPPSIINISTLDNTSFYQKNFTVTAENSLRNVSVTIDVNSSYNYWRLYELQGSTWIDATSNYDLTISNNKATFSGFSTSERQFRIEGSTIACVDNDNDGYYSISAGCMSGNDCNDSNPGINPGATDICGNSIDEDCSGADLSCPEQSPGGTSSGGSSGGGGAIVSISIPTEKPITKEPETIKPTEVKQETGAVSLELMAPDTVESGELYNVTVKLLSPIKKTYTLTISNIKQNVELEAGKEKLLTIPIRAMEARGSFALIASIDGTTKSKIINLDYKPLFLYVNESRIANETLITVTVKNYQHLSTELRIIKDGRSDVFIELIEGQKEYQRQLKLTQSGEYKIMAVASSEGKTIDTDSYMLTISGKPTFDYRLFLIIAFAFVVIVMTLTFLIK